MYIATGQGETTGDNILMSTETSCHFGHLLQVPKKKTLKSDFIQFFHDFIHAYRPGVTGRNFPPVSFFPGEKLDRPILSPGKKLTSQFFPHPVSFSPLISFYNM